MAELEALEWVNPYMTARRRFICSALAQALPNTLTSLASNSPATSAKFKEWTGQTQASLEAAWTREGFTKGANGSWTRPGPGAVTTSCEGLVGTVFSKIEQAGYGKRAGGATSFNLPGNDKFGREAKTPPVGWHWFRDRKPGLRPRPGDVFQIGTEVMPHQWSHAHVGVITQWGDDEPLMWETVEAGQGGPLAGFDSMKRKPYRPVNPIDPKKPQKVIMGWLDIDEHFS